MFTPFTEVIFIDEEDDNTFDFADWKILTQGGYTAYDVKYLTAKAFMNRCPMLVTARRKLEFGPTYQPAMDRRFRTYFFKTLPNPKRKAAAWLRKHAMECVVWAAEKAKDCDSDTESDHDTESDEERIAEDEEGTLKEKEKEVMRSLSLSNPLMKTRWHLQMTKRSFVGTAQVTHQSISLMCSWRLLPVCTPIVCDTGSCSTCGENKRKREACKKT